jgi:hypothetical protein
MYNTAANSLISAATGYEWIAKALTAGQTYYSNGVNVSRGVGFNALLILTDASITVTFQLSMDNVNYYDVYDKNGNLINAIASALAANRWVSFNPQIAKFMRFKVVCNSNATTTLTFVQIEQM